MQCEKFYTVQCSHWVWNPFPSLSLESVSANVNKPLHEVLGDFCKYLRVFVSILKIISDSAEFIEDMIIVQVAQNSHSFTPNQIHYKLL